MNVQNITLQIRRALHEVGIEHPGLEARILLGHAMNCTQEEILRRYDQPLGKDELTIINSLVARRLKGEPIAYILGNREFFGHSFIVNSSVLIPRADSETLIAAVLAAHGGNTDLRILDLGTGSGCLIISLLIELPQSHGVAVEISTDATDVARLNSYNHGLTERLHIINTNWNEFAANAQDKYFDIIIANPPYISETDTSVSHETRCYEPHLALFTGSDGLASYQQLAPIIKDFLAPNGRAYLEIGYGQKSAVTATMAAQHLKAINTFDDLAGIARCIEFSHVSSYVSENS